MSSIPRHLPSPEEIREKTAEIRSGWSEADYRVRATCSTPILGDYGQPKPPGWEVPVIRERDMGVPPGWIEEAIYSEL